MNLVGFLNRSRSYPAPLISVGVEGEDYFAFFPSGDRVKLRGVESLETLRNRDSFLSAAASGVVDVPELAFGISPGQVVAGAGRDVGRLLRSYVAQQGPLVQGEDTESIRSFLLSIGEFTGRINARELVDVLTGRRRLVARINSRQLRRSPHKAQTLLIQLEGRSETRTLYRKGVPRGKALADVRIPSSTARFLQQALF